MKLLHTADWHLGKRLYDRLRLDEQEEALLALCRLADEEQVDAVLVAGDLFDTFNPSNEAVELFYRLLHRLSAGGTRAVVAIAGNHDSAERIQAPDPLAKACGIVLLGFPDSEPSPFALDTGLALLRSAPGFLELQLPRCPHPLRILATPYANEARLRVFLGKENPEASLQEALRDRWQGLADRYCDEEGVNVLMAHLFMAKNADEALPEPDDERGVLHVGGAQVIYAQAIPEAVQYTALGHLHRCHNLGAPEWPVVYSGSLLEYSFSEAQQQKYAVLVEAEPGRPVRWEKRPLPLRRMLHRVRFSDPDEAVAWLAAHQEAFVELTMVSDTYLDGATKKRLYQAHPGIMALVPEVATARPEEAEGPARPDLTQDVETLFRQYFEARQGQAAPEALLEVFREVLALGPEGE
jgi:exonuclease SbcD